jgi:MoxR-like ATPase
MGDAVIDSAPSEARTRIAELIERMGDAIIGQQQVIERLVVGLLANGNLLVEGLPGLAKSRAIKALAKNNYTQLAFALDRIRALASGRPPSRSRRCSTTISRPSRRAASKAWCS